MLDFHLHVTLVGNVGNVEP